MRHRPWFVLISIVTMAFAPVKAFAGELPSLTVQLSTGRKLRAMLDPRTNLDRLWLQFGSSETVVKRGFDWRAVAGIFDGDRPLSQQELVQIAEAARQPSDLESKQRITIRPSETGSDSPAGPTRRETRSPPRVAAATFDAVLGNWDADVATDGLRVLVTPVDINGEPVTVRGVLTVELFSIHRVDQVSVPHGRGSEIRLVGRWSTQVVCGPGASGGSWVRLPFQSAHPEIDFDWAPYGLVHLQFAAPGHGVFHHSIDGLRIRPYAPLRDSLEQKSGTRFLPSELN